MAMIVKIVMTLMLVTLIKKMFKWQNFQAVKL